MRGRGRRPTPLRSTRAASPPRRCSRSARSTARWDGRDREKRFEYRGAARATSAELDPDRVLLLDLRRTNNTQALTPRSSAVASRLAGRWLIWFEDLLLSYASLV